MIADIEAFADLFARLEEVQADLCTCSTVADMRTVVALNNSNSLDQFDALVATVSAGEDEGTYLEDLRAALTAVPYGEVFARPVAAGSDEWLWAPTRDTPTTDWQPFDTMAAPSVADDEAAAEVSVMDESNAIYVRVLVELSNPSPEEANQAWEAIWTKVSHRAASWTPDAADEIQRAVVDDFYQSLAEEDASVDEVIAKLNDLAATIRAIATK
ncbi:hypothetical protein [Amycolatopsis sp. SID8362]|uniref:hypothetical protein n=1 Tax=Amycolatopsis sp. SID8362 TaxID=2690346 RepID=UPI00136C4070|nr:hypothetical protein [Amycolatopsis sp. SID8362]NBH06049.1 hypothetical protein [Amycolatopsis sp. SID8362]NED42748.1 hypothetical protein [Amycolatopsis sp. SID8362]